MTKHEFRMVNDPSYAEVAEGMTLEMRKMARRVALDVFNSIKARTYTIQGGHYIHGVEELDLAGEPMRENVATVARLCRVCALGACILSLSKIDNDFNIPSAGYLRTPLKERLRQVFSLSDNTPKIVVICVHFG